MNDELVIVKEKLSKKTTENTEIREKIQAQQEEASHVEGKFIELTDACEQSNKSKDR